jgi:hypothetical protein
MQSTKSTDCTCEICTRHKTITSLIQQKDVDRLITQVQELSSLLLYTETDLARYKLILSGKWPNSVKILETALENAKKH